MHEGKISSIVHLDIQPFRTYHVLSEIFPAFTTRTIAMERSVTNDAMRSRHDSPGAARAAAARLHKNVLAEREASLKGRPEPVPLPRLILAGLSPYAPSTQKPWDRQRAG